MALFPHLEIENKIQVNDRTRMKAVKSFVSSGADPITTVTIKPGADGSAISVFNADVNLRYLDWEFSAFNGDFDSTNSAIGFNEGSTELSPSISAGTYTLATLATEIKTQMDAAGALTYTVTVDKDEKLTILSTGTFGLNINTSANRDISAWGLLGFVVKPGQEDETFSGKTTYTGKVIRALQKAITLEIGDGTLTGSITGYASVYSVSGDALFSNDSDLESHRSDVLRYVEAGRNSFLKYHRSAQGEILDYFRKNGFIDIFGDPLEIKDMVFPDDLRQWSAFTTLRLIFEDQSNAVDDIFEKISNAFSSKEMDARRQALVRADIDNDGLADIGEGVGTLSIGINRL